MTIGGEKGQHQHYEQNFFSRFRARQTRDKTNSFRVCSRSKFDNSRVFSLSLSLYFHARRKAMTTNTNTNTTTTLYVTPLTSDQCLWCARNNKNKKKNVESQRVKMNFRSIRERSKKRMRELYAYLRRFCTRRWPLSGTALARRSSCRRCASVRLSICPFF